MRQIEFSDHALNQMRERDISREFIKETINHPDKIISQSQRTKALKFFANKDKEYLYVVIYENTAGISKVITAFITSKIKKYF